MYKKLEGYQILKKGGERVHSFEKASFPLKIEYGLARCVELMRRIAIKQNGSTLEQQATCFGHLYTLEWPIKISPIANKTLDQARFEKVSLLPVTDVLLKVLEFLVKETPLLTKLLHKKQEIETWRTLVEYADARITMFSRKRIAG